MGLGDTWGHLGTLGDTWGGFRGHLETLVVGHGVRLGNQLHGIQTFRLTLGVGHLGTLGDTGGHLKTLGVGLGGHGVRLGNQIHGIQTFRLTLGDTWGGFRGHLGTLEDTWGGFRGLGVGLGVGHGVGLGNQLHGIQTFRLLGDTWGGFRGHLGTLGDTWGHLGTLGVGLGNTWRHLGWDMECVWSNLQDVPDRSWHVVTSSSSNLNDVPYML